MVRYILTEAKTNNRRPWISHTRPVFAWREDAAAVMDRMQTYMQSNGAVSVWLFYELCFVVDKPAEYKRYAWTSIPDIPILRVHDGWLLTFDDPVELTETQADALHLLEGVE